jgi:dephospho-CoA kinase
MKNGPPATEATLLLSSTISNTILGITGGVATGKSTVARIFAGLGAAVVSADEIARDVLAAGSRASLKVIEALGPDAALDGSASVVDRAQLGALIFADDSARKVVGEIMHPEIHAQLDARVQELRADADYPLVVVEIPLLYENGLESFVDQVLVVFCSEANQISRIVARNPSLSRKDALQRIHSQLPLAQKAARADYTIDSDRPFADVESEAVNLYDALKRQ